MKRLVKRFNCKGFTLVETLLATFILVVTSTMLINGFVATMGYSYQTSVYNKSGAKNYTACITDVAKWSKTDNLTTKGTNASGTSVTIKGREEQGKAYYVSNGNKTETLKFNTAGSVFKSCSLQELNVQLIGYDDLKLTVPDTVKGYEFSPTKDQLADNREAFLYYPEMWQDSAGGHVGQIIVMYDDNSKKYYWVVGVDSSGNKITNFDTVSSITYAETNGFN